MTQIVTDKWAAAINGDWTNGADWTPSGVPNDTAAFDFFAYLGGSYTVGTGAFTVTSAANETIGFLETGANATFAVNGGQFAIDSFLRHTSALYNYGHLNVATGATLSFGDTAGTESQAAGLWNNGAASIAGTLLINAPSFGLFGSGVLTLTGKIVGALTGTQKLVNHGSTIRGFGSIGQGGNLVFVNGQGSVVDAIGAGVLTLNTGPNTLSNAGTIRTDGTGGLNIVSRMQQDGQLIASGPGALKITSSLVHGGGSLSVGASGSVVLKSGQLSLGGTVTIASGGILTTTTGDLGAVGPNNAFVGDVLSSGDIETDGGIAVADNSILNLNASVYGAGEIDLNASSGATSLKIFSTGSALFESGGVVLSDSVLNKIVSNGAGVQLSNSTKISGAGTIGDGWLRLSNSVLGTIVANGQSKLTIQGDTSSVSAGTEKENFNGGTISSTGPGGLTFLNGSMNNGGYIVENGSGGMLMNNFVVDTGGGVVQVLAGGLTLYRNSVISNQSSVTIAAGASLTTIAGDTADGLTTNVTNAGQLSVAANSTLIAEGHWTNAKTISVGSAAAGGTVSIQAGGTLQLLGAGGSLLLKHVNDRIVSAGAGAKLDNKTNSISGAGTIGDANMAVNNEVGGTIDATVAGGITLNATAEAGGTTYLYNAGTIKADTAAGVTIQAGMDNPGKLIADAGSKIVAQSDVYGAGAATLNGVSSIEFGATSQNDVHFGATSGGDLILDHSTQFSGHIFGMISGDEIDLRDFTFVSGMTGVDAAQSVFGDAAASIVLVNGTSSSATIHLEGSYSRTAFQVIADGAPSGGALLKLS